MNSSPTVTVFDAAEATDADRRRPGRFEVDPSLVPLLRHPERGVEPTMVPAWTPPEQDGRYGAARGIVFAVLLSIPVWGAIGVVAYLLLR